MKERLLFLYRSDKDFQKYFELLHNIYDRIVDDKSREIYCYRLLMTITGEISYIRKLVLTTDAGKELEDFLKKQNKIYLYGAGIRGDRVFKMFPEMKWEGYIDRNKDGIFNGLKNKKPSEVKHEKDAVILITNLEDSNSIKDDLLKCGISSDQIYSLDDYETKAHREQYFEDRCIENFSSTKGAFIDAGSYDGLDSIKFSKSKLNQNAPIYAFEPDETNYLLCKNNLANIKNAEVFNIGLSDIREQGCFTSGVGEASRVEEQGNCRINLDTIDLLLKEKQVGLIKMDVEGSEKNVIIGAQLHIKRDNPNMMISVYHKLEDIIEIPKLLLEINPSYRFAFGHYSVCNADTVLYAFE